MVWQGMFGPKITTVFASRWKALWWAAGMMMTAYCSIPSAEETAESQAAAPAPGSVADPAAVHHSPWAKSGQ